MKSSFNLYLFWYPRIRKMGCNIKNNSGYNPALKSCLLMWEVSLINQHHFPNSYMYLVVHWMYNKIKLHSEVDIRILKIKRVEVKSRKLSQNGIHLNWEAQPRLWGTSVLKQIFYKPISCIHSCHHTRRRYGTVFILLLTTIGDKDC